MDNFFLFETRLGTDIATQKILQDDIVWKILQLLIHLTLIKILKTLIYLLH